MPEGNPNAESFIERWSRAQASERANAQLFLTELTDLLGVLRPENSHAAGYSFEFPVRIATSPKTQSEGRIDLYRRGCFMLEAKQFIAPKTEPTDLERALASNGHAADKKRVGRCVEATPGTTRCGAPKARPKLCKS